MKKREPKNIIFYLPRMQFSNTGDILIHKSLVELLRMYGDLRVYAGKEIPVHIIESLGLENQERFEKMFGCSNFLLIVLLCGIYYFLKGDKVYLFSGPGHIYGASYKRSLINLCAAASFFLLRICAVKCGRIGFSFGPAGTFFGFSEKVRAMMTDCYSVRDHESMKHCKKAGIKKVVYSPDLSWAYKVDYDRQKNKNTIYLSFRSSTFYEKHDLGYVSRLKESIKVVLDSLVKQDQEKSIVIGYQASADKDFSKVLYEALKGDYNIMLCPDQVIVHTLEKTYNDVEFVLSNRMHVLLFAYKFGALPIAVTDAAQHSKISEVFKESGLDDLLVDITRPINDEQLKRFTIQRRLLLDKISEVERINSLKTTEVLNNFFKVTA